MKIFGVSAAKIEKTFLNECGLIIGQGRLPSASLTALDNSAYRRTETTLRIILTDNQKWNLFIKLIEKMKLTLEEELITVNEYVAQEVARNCVLQVREFTNKKRFMISIMPNSAIGRYVLSDPSLYRGKKMRELISRLNELEEIQDFNLLKKWALEVGKLGIN